MRPAFLFPETITLHRPRFDSVWHCMDTTKAPVDEDLASLPMLSPERYTEQTGLSPTTLWRYRKKGWLAVVNICGRFYITRAEIARFNARATAGEFADEVQKPCGPKSRREGGAR